MLDIVAMWKQPRMIAYMFLTAALYSAILYPFQAYSFFHADADYLRLAMGIPVAFSFLFGPAAAWGAAFGNLIFDAATGLSAVSFFGFWGNFLVAYIPYKLWTNLTAEKPDLRNTKKIGLFIGLAALACAVCGLVIGWGLLYLYNLPFVMTTFTIFSTDALWAIILGPIILATSYGFVSRRRQLYTDLLKIQPQLKPSWNRTKTLAIAVLLVCILAALVLEATLNVGTYVLLAFVAVSLVATATACR